MKRTAIDALLDSLEYEKVEYVAVDSESQDGLAHITHQGRLRIGEMELRVYVLSSGERVIDADDVEKFFSV